MRKSRINKALHLLITMLSLIFIMIIVLISHKAGEIELSAGVACPEDIFAPSTVTDTVTTEQLRDKARAEISDVYDHDPTVGENSINTVSNLLSEALDIKEDESRDRIERIAVFQEKCGIELSEMAASEIVNSSKTAFDKMYEIIDIVEDTMMVPISDVEAAKKACNEQIDKIDISGKQKNALKEIVSLVVVENLKFNPEKTEAERTAAAEAIKDIEYKKNQIIVRKGEIVTEAHIRMLSTLGMLKGSDPTPTYTVGVLLLVLICYVILAFFFYGKFRKQISTLPILAITALLIIVLSFYGSRYVPEDMVSVLPFGLFPGIAAIFSSSPVAIITNLILAIFCGVVFDANWGLTICLFVAGTISAYSFAAVKRRSHLLPAAIVSSVFYAITFFAMSFIEVADASSALATLGKGFLGGILSGLITIGSIQFFEWMFNATTPMKLSELTNPENKLLKKLLVEAPGSYHHALTVANISEIAARSIKADSLLARVGAYYHDIGKIRHPLYFKENQYDQNAHDNLTPEQSSAVIISHVTDGVEIAKRYRLPQVICDIISQHHGTTTTGYFLIRAREIDPNVDPKKFTYPGPIPQTKEAAIVMLADSCEAAVRSIDDKTEAKIEAMVRKIATERVNSGQFSQCNLTFSELEMVIKVITKTLGGYFHERIKYE